MAPPAGSRTVGVIHGRPTIIDTKNLVRRSVTPLAVRPRAPSGLVRSGVRAVRVGGLRVGMTIGTGNFPWKRFVRQAPYGLVAIHA